MRLSRGGLGLAAALACSAGPFAAAAQAPIAAAAGAIGPRCVPAQLNTSAVVPGTEVAVSPLPGSYDASPATQISMLGGPAGAIAGLKVSGSRTGPHSGVLRRYSQGDGASFVPAKPFAAGETVRVSGTATGASGRASFSYSFRIAVPDPIPHPPVLHAIRDPNEKQHYHTRPDVEPPRIIVTARSASTAGGYIFADPANGPGPSGPMIFDEAGNLIWFDPIPNGQESTNLQVQQLEGRPVLSWWQGVVPPQGFGLGEEIVVDQGYHQLMRVRAGNGFQADLHDFRITPQMTGLLTVFNTIDCNLAPYGGRPFAAVTDGVFQEIDLRTGLVRKEWHSLDHVRLTDSHNVIQAASLGWPFDFFHINSVTPAANGMTVISARNTWAIYELNAVTGQIATVIGGKSSAVRLPGGAVPAFQHDAEARGQGVISVFDNGGVPRVHSQSRGLIVAINAAARSGEVVAEFIHPTPLLSGSQGSIQLLANGDDFIGWGAQPYFSEFSPTGTLLFDAHMPGSYGSYRAYRFPWTGAPAYPPSIATSTTTPGVAGAVWASWNGDTRTSAWRLTGGSNPRRLHVVAQAQRTGFETAIGLQRMPKYVAVQALSETGAVLRTSPVVRG